MVVENGAPVKAIALHSNGAIAIETTTTGANFNRTFYDENGNTIEEREFEKKLLLSGKTQKSIKILLEAP